MRFRPAVGEVVEEGAGRAAGIVGAQLLEHGAFESFHQLAVRLFFFQPFEGEAEKTVQGFQVGIRLGGLLDGLGKVGGGQDPGIGLAQAGTGVDDAGFTEVVEGGPAGGFPTNFTFMEKIQVAAQRAAGFGGPFGQSPDHPMAAGEPNRQQAGLSLAAEMEQNPFILKRLAQDPSLAEGANREDKRDDSGRSNV